MAQRTSPHSAPRLFSHIPQRLAQRPETHTHTFGTMGTVASLVFAGPLPDPACLAAIEQVFRDDDQTFSLYRPNSPLSRIARGELTLGAASAASAAIREAYAAANDWRLHTNGAFTPHRPDGVIDLSGIVKARSMARAEQVLRDFDVTDAILDVGGDAVAHGTVAGGPWMAGIVDPHERTVLLCRVPLGSIPLCGIPLGSIPVGRLSRDGGWSAIATSGTSERGDHVWGLRPRMYSQVTVLAADIVTADVLATAILAGGPEMCSDALDRWDIDVLTVDLGGELTVSDRLRSMLQRSDHDAD